MNTGRLNWSLVTGSVCRFSCTIFQAKEEVSKPESAEQRDSLIFQDGIHTITFRKFNNTGTVRLDRDAGQRVRLPKSLSVVSVKNCVDFRQRCDR